MFSVPGSFTTDHVLGTKMLCRRKYKQIRNPFGIWEALTWGICISKMRIATGTWSWTSSECEAQTCCVHGCKLVNRSFGLDELDPLSHTKERKNPAAGSGPQDLDNPGCTASITNGELRWFAMRFLLYRGERGDGRQFSLTPPEITPNPDFAGKR
jgi:hypothetical protein